VVVLLSINNTWHTKIVIPFTGKCVVLWAHTNRYAENTIVKVDYDEVIQKQSFACLLD
jgi:hypothetical protein